MYGQSNRLIRLFALLFLPLWLYGQDVTIDINIDPINVFVPAEGDTFPYQLLVENQIPESQVVDIWIDMMLPTGSIVPVLNPRTPTLPPFGVLDRSPLMKVAEKGPPGDYILYAYVGQFDSDTTHADTVRVTKLAPDTCDFELSDTLFVFDIRPGEEDSTVFYIHNTGNQNLDWLITETPTGPNFLTLSDPAPVAATSPEAPTPLILDDGSFESTYRAPSGGQFVWLNRFTPTASLYPFDLTRVDILFGAGRGVMVGDLIDLYFYQDLDGDNDPGTGASFVGSVLNQAVQAVDDTTWSVYNFSPIGFSTPGDLLIAAVNRTAGIAPGNEPVLVDTTESLQRSWIGIYATPVVPDPPFFPANATWDLVDNLFIGGNHMMRGCVEPGEECDWEDFSSDSGSVNPGDSIEIKLCVSAETLAPGTYCCVFQVEGCDSQVVEFTVKLNVKGDTKAEVAHLASAKTEEPLLPRAELLDNYPNPFNPSTTIAYRLPQEQRVTLTIYNTLGQVVRRLVDDIQQPGYHEARWDGQDQRQQPAASGLYLYQLNAGGEILNGKMLLMK